MAVSRCVILVCMDVQFQWGVIAEIRLTQSETPCPKALLEGTAPASPGHSSAESGEV